MLFSDINAEIHFDTHTVIVAGQEHKIRPKTFRLLQMLIEADGELVSKSRLLETVWDDVVVDEQVIFQSIKEIRKIFSGQTVIKTVPRKGYAWIPKQSFQESTIEEKRKHKSPLLTNLVAFSVAFILFLSWTWLNPEPELVSGSIVVLPVQSDISSGDYEWVRYGVMDQVISRLTSSAQAGVLQTDYVLDVIARAKLTKSQLSDGQVNAIFDVSGAELILSMRLTGNPKDYQIIYSLYQRDGVDKGVVLDDSVQDAADQIAKLVGNRISSEFEISKATFESSFTHRLIAEALEAKNMGNSDKALTLLEAAYSTDPQDLVAARLLVQSLVESGASLENIKSIANPAIDLAQSQDRTIDQIRLEFWLAVSESMYDDPKMAMQRFESVESLAKSINDWLYLAYVEEIRGQYQLANQKFAQADHHFQNAMEYHGVLHCPLGKSNTLMHMSRLSKAKGDREQAINHAQQALAIVQKRRLSTKLPVTQQWLKELTK